MKNYIGISRKPLIISTITPACFSNPGSKTPLINAFKANALIQARDIDPEEAMKEYIDLVNAKVKKLS